MGFGEREGLSDRIQRAEDAPHAATVAALLVHHVAAGVLGDLAAFVEGEGDGLRRTHDVFTSRLAEWSL